MSSRCLSTFAQMLVPHECAVQTSILCRGLSRTARPVSPSMGSTGKRYKTTLMMMTAGFCFSGGLALGAAVSRKKPTRVFSSLFVADKLAPSQLVLKRSSCAKAVDPKGVSERDLPGWTPLSRDLYREYCTKLLQDKGWCVLLNSVDRERNKTGFTLNHPEVGATFEYAMFYNEEEKKSITVLQLGEKIQGPPGYVHGGAIATAGDACAGVLVFSGLKIMCVTANLTVNYKKPLPVNSTIIVETVVDKIEGRKYHTTSVFKSIDGSIIYDIVTCLFIDVSKHVKK